MDDSSLFKSRIASSQCESASLLARHQLYILDLAHSELVKLFTIIIARLTFVFQVRQVSIQCTERGQLMHTIWALNAELYNTVIKEQQAVMQGLHRRVLDAISQSDQLEEKMKLMEQSHKEQVAELLANSELGKKEKENSAFRRLQQDMLLLERDAKIMEASLSDLSVWFPNFHLYSNSILRRLLPETPFDLESHIGDESGPTRLLDLPQNRLFKDLKRIEKMELGFTVFLQGGGEEAGNDNDSDNGGTDTLSDAGESGRSSRPGSGRAEIIRRESTESPHSPKTSNKSASNVKNMTFTDTFIRSSETTVPQTPPSHSALGIVSPPSKNMRAIIYENQVQKIAIQDYEVKLKELEFKSSKREEGLKSKVLKLQQQVRSLSSIVVGDGGGSNNDKNVGASSGTAALSNGVHSRAVIITSPFPEHQPAISLTEELSALADIYTGKNGGGMVISDVSISRNLTISTPAIVPVAEIQRVFQSFFNHFAMEMLPSNMMCGTSSAQTTFITGSGNLCSSEGLGRSYNSTSMFDLSLTTVEGYILSQWNLHAKLSPREARDKLRGLMWSIMVWLQSSATSYYYSGANRNSARPARAAVGIRALENTVITINVQEDLPRSAEENEKGFLLCLSMLLGIRYRRPAITKEKQESDEDKNKMKNLSAEAAGAAAKKMVPGPIYPLRDSIYAQVFATCYQALQRYMRFNTKLNTSHVASSNIMEKAAKCPVPTSHVRRVLKRIITIAPPCVFYVPKNAMSEYYKIFTNEKKNVVSSSSNTNNSMVIFNSSEGGTANSSYDLDRREEDRELARKLQTVVDLGKSRPWYFQMPQKRFEKIVSDCMTLSYKDAGISCDSYDVISVVWDNVCEYHDDLRQTLMSLYSFADAVSGGSIAGFMFLSIVFNVIEMSDALLGPLKSSLTLEWVTAASVDKLNAEFFAQSILRSGALLTGLHSLFEGQSETKAELFMGLRYLFEKLLQYDSVNEAMAHMEDSKETNQDAGDIAAQSSVNIVPMVVEYDTDGRLSAHSKQQSAGDAFSVDDTVSDPSNVNPAKEVSGVVDDAIEDDVNGLTQAALLDSSNNGARADASATTNATKRVSRLSTLHVPDIGSLMTRCQMCLESIFGSAECASDSSNVTTGFVGGTVPMSQVYFCYKSLEFLLTHFGPEFDYQNVLTLEQEALANRYKRTAILRRVYKAWATCVENGGAVYIKDTSEDEARLHDNASSSDDDIKDEAKEEFAPTRPIVRRRQVASLNHH